MADNPVILLADAGPLITLAYADALDVLLLPNWQVQMVDMVLHEVTRNPTPTSQKIAAWVAQQQLLVRETRIYQRYIASLNAGEKPRKANLGELAIQEVMSEFALQARPVTGVFLFEDHKVARASFVLPEDCHKISTRAFLLFLEQKGLVESAAAIERRAIQAGRAFSSIRFPP
ncbi:MAG: hypothetical protein RI964_1808 [Pseudomonadota bacterium]|jgi:hypothetical protein